MLVWIISVSEKGFRCQAPCMSHWWSGVYIIFHSALINEEAPPDCSIFAFPCWMIVCSQHSWIDLEKIGIRSLGNESIRIERDIHRTPLFHDITLNSIMYLGQPKSLWDVQVKVFTDNQINWKINIIFGIYIKSEVPCHKGLIITAFVETLFLSSHVCGQLLQLITCLHDKQFSIICFPIIGIITSMCLVRRLAGLY